VYSHCPCNPAYVVESSSDVSPLQLNTVVPRLNCDADGVGADVADAQASATDNRNASLFINPHS
jgi:hypothetical protein